MEINIGSYIQQKVRNGVDTFFWFHQWTNDLSLHLQFPKIFHLAADPLISVKDAWNIANNSWDPQFRCSLLSWEIQSQTSISTSWQIPVSYMGNDITYWAFESNGCFSVKSTKNTRAEGLIYMAPLMIGYLWKTLLPKKCKFFIWSLIHKGINTTDKYQSRHPSLNLNPNWCILCRSQSESMDHLFSSSNFSKAIRFRFYNYIDSTTLHPINIDTLLGKFLNINPNSQRNILLSNFYGVALASLA